MKYSDIDWSRALCRKYDPEIWQNEDTEADAQMLCRAPCPIIVECGQWAIDHKEASGVWGGFTESERKLASWRKHRVRCPGCASTNVSEMTQNKAETCLNCGLSWKI